MEVSLIKKEFRNKKIYKKIFLSYIIICSSLLLIFILGTSVLNARENVLNNNTIINYAVSSFDETINLGEIEKKDFVREVYITENYSAGPYLDFEINNETYSVNQYFRTLKVDYQDKVFSNVQIEEYNKKYKDIIKYGNMPEQDNEIIISERIIKSLGFEIEQILNKNITIKISGKMPIPYAGSVWLENVKVSGIINDNFLELYDMGEEEMMKGFIYVSNNLEDKSFIEKNKTVSVYFNDFENLDEKIHELNKLTGLDFECGYSMVLNFLEYVESYCKGITTILMIVLIILTFCFVIYGLINNFLLTIDNDKYYYLLKCCGKNKKELFTQCVLTQGIMMLLSLGISLIIYTFYIFILKKYLDNMFESCNILLMKNIFLSILFTVMVLIFILIINSFLPLLLKRKNNID